MAAGTSRTLLKRHVCCRVSLRRRPRVSPLRLRCVAGRASMVQEPQGAAQRQAERARSKRARRLPAVASVALRLAGWRASQGRAALARRSLRAAVTSAEPEQPPGSHNDAAQHDALDAPPLHFFAVQKPPPVVVVGVRRSLPRRSPVAGTARTESVLPRWQHVPPLLSAVSPSEERGKATPG